MNNSKSIRNNILSKLLPSPLLLRKRSKARAYQNLKLCMGKGLARKPLVLVDISSIGYMIFLRHCVTCPIAEVKEIVETKLFAYLFGLIEDFKTPKIVLLYDSKTNLRKKELPTYKAKRLDYKTPQEIEKIMEMKKVLRRFRKTALQLGFNCCVQKGYECDDLMAVFSRSIACRDNPVVIVANDGDLFQLLSPYCKYFCVRMNTLIEEEDFTKKYGYPSSRVVAVKCITGCTSDNVKGVGGVGEGKMKKFLSGDSKVCEEVQSKLKKALANKRYVSLPFEGTRMPVLLPFTLNMKFFEKCCREYGMRFMKRKDVYAKIFNV